MKNKFNFAITDSTTYTGKDAEGFYSAALLSAPTVANVTLVPNVKSSIKLGKFDLGNIIQDESCSFNASGEGTLSQKTFTVSPKKINLEYCTSTFEQNYLNEFMKAGSSEVMPATFQDYIVTKVSEKTAGDLEVAYWKGVGSGSTYPQNVMVGLEAKLSADTDVLTVTATTLTSANIIAEMKKVYDLIPSTIFGKEDLKMFLSTKGIKLFKQAIAAANTLSYYTLDAELNFLGVKVVEAKGLSDDKMVATQSSNLLWLTDLMSDAEDVLIIPQKNISGVPSVRFIANFKAGSGYLYGAEIVYHA